LSSSFSLASCLFFLLAIASHSLTHTQLVCGCKMQQSIDERPTSKYSFEQHNKGQNLEISEHGMLARRVKSFMQSSTYIPTPLAAGLITIGDKDLQGFKVTLTIVEEERWAGGLKLGFTTTDPSTLDFTDLQISNCPVVLRASLDKHKLHVGYIKQNCAWLKIIAVDLTKHHGPGDVISMAFTPHDNKLFIEFNDQVVIDGADLPDQWLQQFNTNQQRIFFVVEPYGQTKTVRLSPTQPLLTWTPTTHHMYPMQTRQAITTLMILAMPSRDGYSRFDDRGLNLLYLLPNELLFMIFDFLCG
jgi:hypothetical protein